MMKSLIHIVKIEGFIILAEIFQILLQTLTGKENTALYGTDRQSQAFCNFTIFES